MKNTLLPIVACVALLAALTGCQSLPQNQSARKTRVTHVVVCWLKHHGDAAERRKLVEASKTFKAIPGVTEVSAGSVLPLQKPGVDASYDVAVVIGFKDEKSLADFGKNPVHLKALKELLMPLASKYVVYNFVNQ